MSDLGIHQGAMGRYGIARVFHERALQTAERGFEPGHRSIAIRQSNLAVVLQDLGQLEEARDLLKKALASAKRAALAIGLETNENNVSAPRMPIPMVTQPSNPDSRTRAELWASGKPTLPRVWLNDGRSVKYARG